jgi:hypothetical protein
MQYTSPVKTKSLKQSNSLTGDEIKPTRVEVSMLSQPAQLVFLFLSELQPSVSGTHRILHKICTGWQSIDG